MKFDKSRPPLKVATLRVCTFHDSASVSQLSLWNPKSTQLCAFMNLSTWENMSLRAHLWRGRLSMLKKGGTYKVFFGHYCGNNITCAQNTNL